jgi:phage FluMu protein Com
MAKQQSFQDKIAKASMQAGKKCPKCGAIKESVLLVNSEPSKHGSVRFNHRRVQVCKCNEKEVYA